MTIIKTAFVAASLVFAVTAANAREDLNSGFHGNTTYKSGSSVSQQALGAFAQSGTVRRPVARSGTVRRPVAQSGTVRPSARMNPLNDMFHGLAVR